MAHRLLPRKKSKAVDKARMKKIQTAAEKELSTLQELMTKNLGDLDGPNDGEGKTCLKLELESGHKKLVNLLQQLGVIENAEDELGNGPLFAAVAIGDKGVVKDREANYNPNPKNRKRLSVTYWAAKHNAKDVAIVFRKMGIRLTYDDVCDAAKSGHDEMSKLLKDLETDFAELDMDGRSALHRAAFENNDAVLRYFLATGHSIEVKDLNHRTPLHHATYNECEAAMKLLVLSGADLNAQDISRRTPLHLAAFTDNFEFVKHLVEAGANVNQKDAIGKTALELARGKNKKIITKYLQSKETP